MYSLKRSASETVWTMITRHTEDGAPTPCGEHEEDEESKDHEEDEEDEMSMDPP